MTAITEETPTITPASVSAERSAFARKASSAMATLSRMFIPRRVYS